MIALIVSSVGLRGSCVARTSGYAWDGKRVIFGLSGLTYLVGGAFGSVEGGPSARYSRTPFSGPEPDR